ncbi:MFS transporter [Bacillus carboniphilus]|uniref:MFS transporter n=1 Tax=Bacillus carboniphilus TaxID=86663 RepID=A0ABY9JY69_9BACI|nr:MFS transporter [Bacillus carboniphilus]WLR44336.1 MFS transporter [Bacillus carboniphilus]
MFSRPLSGKWLDQYGRKKVFLIARMLFAVCMFLYIGIKGLLFFFFLRFVHGFGFGMATTASGTMAADIIPQERRAEGMGYYSSFASIAMIVGPLLGLFILQIFNYNILFLTCSSFAILSLLLGYFIKVELNENSTKKRRKQ